MNISYKNKYLKYKQKYLKLKNQIGGSSNPNPDEATLNLSEIYYKCNKNEDSKQAWNSFKHFTGEMNNNNIINLKESNQTFDQIENTHDIYRCEKDYQKMRALADMKERQKNKLMDEVEKDNDDDDDDSSDDEDDQDLPKKKPVYRAKEAQFRDSENNIIDVVIRENTYGLGVIGQSEIIRDTKTYAFRWKSRNKQNEFYDKFKYDGDPKIFYKLGMESALRTQFTQREKQAFDKKYPHLAN
jgi:hypothetical protein